MKRREEKKNVSPVSRSRAASDRTNRPSTASSGRARTHTTTITSDNNNITYVIGTHGMSVIDGPISIGKILLTVRGEQKNEKKNIKILTFFVWIQIDGTTAAAVRRRDTLRHDPSDGTLG